MSLILFGCFLVIAAALAISTGPVLANPILPANTEIWNGGFDWPTGGNVNWSRGNSSTGMLGGPINGQSALYSSASGTHNA